MPIGLSSMKSNHVDSSNAMMNMKFELILDDFKFRLYKMFLLTPQIRTKDCQHGNVMRFFSTRLPRTARYGGIPEYVVFSFAAELRMGTLFPTLWTVPFVVD